MVTLHLFCCLTSPEGFVQICFHPDLLSLIFIISQEDVEYFLLNIKIPIYLLYPSGLPWWLSGKESTAGSMPGSKRSPGDGNGNSFCYSFLKNPMDKGAWWAIESMGLQKSQT